jgi:hypothetical protein
MSVIKPNSFLQKEIRYTWQEFYEIENESRYILSEKVIAILAKLSEDVGIPTGALLLENGGNGGNNGGGRQQGANRTYTTGIKGNGTGNTVGGRSQGLGRQLGSGGSGNKVMGPLGAGSQNKGEELLWENVRKNVPIPTRKVEKVEGIEKIIQEIRICLNKLTDKNYAKQLEEIREKMKSLSITEAESGEAEAEAEAEAEEGGKEGVIEEKQNEWKKVATILFDIASTNKFFSKIYAQLYLELMKEFVIFQEILDSFLEGFISKLQTIQYIDPDKDYDGYCLYTKQQDERKAMTGFIVHLAMGFMVVDGIKGGEMMRKLNDIVTELVDKVIGFIDKEGSTNEVEEITEILFLFFSLGGKSLLEEWKTNKETWENVSDKIMMLSKQKVKEHKSFSSRALFKFLDIQKILSN